MKINFTLNLKFEVIIYAQMRLSSESGTLNTNARSTPGPAPSPTAQHQAECHSVLHQRAGLLLKMRQAYVN